jgi:hypothetical protein
MTEPSESHAALTVAKAMAQSKLPLAVALSPNTTRLLQPRRRRLFVVPFLVFGFTALLTTVGIKRLGPIEKPQPQAEASDPTPPTQHEEQPIEVTSLEDAAPEQPVKPAEPFRSLALDAARLYVATKSFPKAMLPAKSANTQKAR